MFSMCHSITRFQEWFQHYCLPSKVKLSIANLGTVLSQWAKTSNSQCRSVFWITVNLYLYFYNIVRSQSHWLLTLFLKTSHDRCKVLICCLEHADEMHTNANLFCFLFSFFLFSLCKLIISKSVQDTSFVNWSRFGCPWFPDGGDCMLLLMSNKMYWQTIHSVQNFRI